MNAGDAVVDALAAHRLTRLATADVLTRPWRAWVIRYAYSQPLTHASYVVAGTENLIDPRATPRLSRADLLARTEAEWDSMPEADDNAPKLADFVKCRWCAGMWISFGVVAARRYAPQVWDPLARALALSTAAALLAGLEQD